MDNITHTLVGALIGETAARTAPPAASDRHAASRRMMFLGVTIVGSNLPDSDLLYSLGSDDKLAYLLEHRGHTHTAIGALVASVVMLALCALWRRWRDVPLSREDWIRLAGLALLAPSLHLAMDALNTYGVHPWWPLDNRWFYGDSVFIIEPLFWASAASLAFLLRSYASRGLVLLTLLAGLWLAFTTEIVSGGSIAAYCVLALAMLAMGRFAPPGVALSSALGACLLISVIFSIASRQALARVETDGSARFTGWTTLDRVLTPLPMNPLCWDVILVQADGHRYALRRATASIVPSLRCPGSDTAHATTAPLQDMTAPDTPFLRWHGEIIASRDRLRELAATSCEVAAFLRFGRAPCFVERDEQRLIGDLRYDRGPELGFAELDLARSPQCPGYVPPWVPPRSDLLTR